VGELRKGSSGAGPGSIENHAGLAIFQDVGAAEEGGNFR
jgi:hypothetical protein